MALNLNSSPYFDDFDGDNNYNRILFKPGVAVQARELTQLQTVLSDQLSQLGSFTLKEGAIISGCEEKVSRLSFIKITDSNFDGLAVINSTLKDYVGATLVGGSTGLRAKVISSKTGTTGGTPNTKTFYITYIDSVAATNTNGVLEFEEDEKLTVDSEDSDLNGHTFVTYNSGESATVGSRDRYSGFAPFLTLSPGIIFALGTFIRTTEISTFIDNYTQLADRKVGFVVTDKIVKSSTDATLLDPASGSFNFNAPGADRLQKVVTLKSFNNTETLPDNFFQYASWEFGKIVRSEIKTDPLGGISKAIAERAYNTNGNYVINGLQTFFREHLDDGNNGGLLSTDQGGLSTKLAAVIRPGKANVAGYPVDLLAQKIIPFDKPSATRIENSVSQSTSFGNYVIVADVAGAWDVDGSDGVAGNGIVDFYDTAQDAVTDGTFSATTASGLKVGTAKTRHIVLHSGTPGTAAAQYKLYLYDIKMSKGDFKDVEGIVYENTNADAFADIVLDSGGDAVLKETNFNKLLWNLPYSHLKTLQADSSAYDYNFKFTKEADLSADTAGIINVTLSGNQKFFFGSDGNVVSDSVTTANIQLLATDQFTVGSTVIKEGEYIDLSGLVTRVSDQSLTIDLGDSISELDRGVRLFVNVKESNTAPISKTLLSDRYVKIDATTNANSASGKYSLGISDVFRIKQILATDNSDYTTNTRDVTTDFILDKGQKENYYGLGSIQKRSGSSLDTTTYRYITVKLDYFSRTVSGPSFACVDSYPVNDTGGAGTIKTQEIPIFGSSSGNVYDLKNAIDFRPYTVNTAANSTSIAGATENPSILEEIDRPSNGLTNPVPTEEFVTDLEYYLAEAYRVVLTQDRKFRVVKSAASISPQLPKVPERAMTLATGFLPPYPCISKQSAKFYGRQDLSVSIKLQKNKRYRMRDIGALEERISNLEYYTTLTLLERQAGDVKILDADGVDRFKNGFLVDSFTGFGVNSVTHQDNNCSIDKKKRQLRAAFKSSVIGFKPKGGPDTTVGQTGDMFHVPYFESIYASQLQASKYRNVVGELLIATDAEVDPPTPTPTTPVTPTVPPVPVAPGEPTFALVRSKTSVNEGKSFTITLETDNVAAGTLVPYTITGTGITTADIGGASLTGNFTVDTAGDAFQTFNVTADATTEGAETFTLTLDGKSISTSVTFNDTSTTIIVDPPLGPFIGSMTLTPSEDTWYDIHAAPDPYTNENGEYDNLAAGAIIKEGSTTSGWTLEWGAWEYAASTVGAEYPGDQFGIEFDGVTSQTEDGVYLPSYGVTWTNQQAIAAQSTTTWEIRSKNIWQYTGVDLVRGEDETDYTEDADTFLRPVQITGSVEGLLPNASHAVTMAGVRKGSLTSNANGRGTFTINVGTGEFRTGNLTIQVSNTESIASATSFAQATFTANHSKQFLKATFISTKGPMPSAPITPEVQTRSETTLIVLLASSITIVVFTETASATTDVVVMGEFVITTNVPVDEIDLQDQVVETSCDLTQGVSRAVMQRADGTQYDLEIDDRGCFIHDDYKATLAKPVVVETGSTYDPTTRTAIKNDTSVNTTIVIDEANNIDDNTGGVHVVTATNFKDELEITVVNSENADFNIIENISLTVANTSGANASTEVVERVTNVTNSDNIVNDATTDSTLNTVVESGMNFDFSSFDLFCIGDLWGSGGADDPLAQTFLVENMPGGMFITSADIFFRSISAEENNNGIKLQIREVINGVPGPTIVPNGEVHVRRSHCYTSTIESDGSVKFAATNFKFKNPIHLNNNTEYCMVLKPDANDPGYEVWIAELGGTEVGKTSVVSKQAHSGVLYTSANNRSWSPHQSEDLMFVLRRAKFEVDTDFVLNVENKNTDWIKFDNTTWDTTETDGKISAPRFVKGDAVHGFTITLDTAGAGYTNGTYNLVFTNTGTNGTSAAGTYVVAGGVVTSVTLTNPGSGYTSAPTVALSDGSPTTAGTATLTLNRGIHKFYDRGYSTYELDITDGFFTVGDMVGNGTTFVDIASINNRAVSALVMQASTINPDDRGTITPKMALTKTSSSTANTDTYSDVTLQTTQELSEEKTIFSYSNEQARDNEKTARFKFTLNTTSNNVSPMIDLASLDMLSLVNDINSPSTVSEEVTVGGNVKSKYISKQVILAEGQDGEDFKVYLDNAIPSGAGVEVYVKLQNSADDANFLNDIYWKKLEIDEQPFVATKSLAEYSYKIPDKAAGFGLNGSGILEYDVERVSSIAITSGGAGYSSAPTITLTDSDGNGYGAVAEAVLTGNAVTSIRILDPGREYTGTVTATVSGGGFTTEAVLGAVTKQPVTYTGFKYFAVKIVHLSSDTAIIPRSSGLRAYALQA